MSTSGFEYGNSYGGSNNAYGGGGGLDPMGGEGFGTFAESGAVAKSAEKKGSKERQTLTPVTIKQLLGADNSDDVMKVDGTELHHIKIVVLIDSTEEHATNHTFQVSDSSGSIECKKWIERDGGKRSEKQDQCIANTLVRVCGCLREYEGRRHVLVYDMTPITDWNEMTHHFLESIMIHLQHTRGPIGGGTKMETSSFASPGMTGHHIGGARGTALAEGEKQIEEALLDLFRVEDSEGINCESAHHMIRQNARFSSYSLLDVRRIVTSMSNQGRVYSTIDDEHFKSTE